MELDLLLSPPKAHVGGVVSAIGCRWMDRFQPPPPPPPSAARLGLVGVLSNSPLSPLSYSQSPIAHRLVLLPIGLLCRRTPPRGPLRWRCFLSPPTAPLPRPGLSSDVGGSSGETACNEERGGPFLGPAHPGPARPWSALLLRWPCGVSLVVVVVVAVVVKRRRPEPLHPPPSRRSQEIQESRTTSKKPRTAPREAKNCVLSWPALRSKVLGVFASRIQESPPRSQEPHLQEAKNCVLS